MMVFPLAAILLIDAAMPEDDASCIELSVASSYGQYASDTCAMTDQQGTSGVASKRLFERVVQVFKGSDSPSVFEIFHVCMRVTSREPAANGAGIEARSSIASTQIRTPLPTSKPRRRSTGAAASPVTANATLNVESNAVRKKHASASVIPASAHAAANLKQVSVHPCDQDKMEHRANSQDRQPVQLQQRVNLGRNPAPEEANATAVGPGKTVLKLEGTSPSSAALGAPLEGFIEVTLVVLDGMGEIMDRPIVYELPASMFGRPDLGDRLYQLAVFRVASEPNHANVVVSNWINTEFRQVPSPDSWFKARTYVKTLALPPRQPEPGGSGSDMLDTFTLPETRAGDDEREHISPGVYLNVFEPVDGGRGCENPSVNLTLGPTGAAATTAAAAQTRISEEQQQQTHVLNTRLGCGYRVQGHKLLRGGAPPFLKPPERFATEDACSSRNSTEIETRLDTGRYSNPAARGGAAIPISVNGPHGPHGPSTEAPFPSPSEQPSGSANKRERSSASGDARGDKSAKRARVLYGRESRDATQNKLTSFAQRLLTQKRREIVHCVEFDDLVPFFHLPREEVHSALGISLTLFKKICRRLGVHEWPYRTLRGFETRERTLELEKGPEVDAELKSIEQKRRHIYQVRSATSPSSTPEPRDPR
ncbi:hypothetical protein FVE85_7649 [Porphyridium purpureum]|uniref:RWP-RK domain-containing protein n=1 Tax=Porphyridium purpureum TaxID=35688 RepID=A0A5J4ZAQ2_PORPP|nr:hypothetical protein FVE85_7649 [Porphyridium purpureum]|eukprot:POR8440..scf295_1